MAEPEHGDSVYRPAAYVGSFAVGEIDPRGRTDRVQQELEALRVHKKERHVIIVVSVKGIKICSDDQSTVFMAHALRRISYATCDAVHRQFAFLAREPSDEVNTQYCHVFVTESSAQAEELNRIVGDAFQLAYVQQLLLKQQRQNTNNNNHASLDFIVPRLCDRHPRWSPSHSVPSNGQQSILSFLELPPPPSCPPPCSVAQQATPRLQSPTRQCSVDSGNGPRKLDASSVGQVDQEKDSPPSEETQSAFRKRAVPNRNNGHGFFGISDSRIVGGSTRQPRRRQGLGWTHIFASARHSAFIPGTQQKNQPPASPDLLELLDCRRKSPRKTNIFLDLRTFAGGSPVVALKERLDAQAIADAKASAFAETAAVLAAAKQANSVSSASPTSSSSRGESRLDPCSSTENSPCSTTSTHSEPSRIIDASLEPNEVPPVPPVRLFSLRRGQARLRPSSPPKSPQQSELIVERVYDEADTSTDQEEFQRNPSKRYPANRDGCVPSRPFKLSQISADGRSTHSTPQTHNHWTGESGRRRSSQPVFVRDNRVHQRPSPRVDHNSGSPTQGPLHITVSKSTCANFTAKPFTSTNGTPSQGFVDMTTSTLSTETPTPTATPTPTPIQTPQPMNNGVIGANRGLSVWDYPEDAEFLKHAPWYQAHLPRDVAYELLFREEPGSFIVRNSISHPECCALSVRVPPEENSAGITHYLIQRTPHGVRLKGLDKWWPSLKALITHLTVIPEMMPCPLRLPQCISNPVFIQAEARLTNSDKKSASNVDNSFDHVQVSGREPNGCEPDRRNSLTQSDTDFHHSVSDSISEVSLRHEGTEEPPSTPVRIAEGQESHDEEYQHLSDFSSILADLEPPAVCNRSLASSC